MDGGGLFVDKSFYIFLDLPAVIPRQIDGTVVPVKVTHYGNCHAANYQGQKVS